GLAGRVRVEVGPALEVLPRVAAELGPRSIELAFLDADRKEFEAYWAILRPLLAPGGLLVADNVLGSTTWWIDDAGEPDRDAVDRFNRAIAGDPGLEATAVLTRHGLLVARRRGDGDGSGEGGGS